MVPLCGKPCESFALYWNSGIVLGEVMLARSVCSDIRGFLLNRSSRVLGSTKSSGVLNQIDNGRDFFEGGNAKFHFFHRIINKQWILLIL